MSALQLIDQDTRADLSTYLTRARRLDEDGAVRLQASGRTLAVWVGVLKGRGISGDGTVIGLRVVGLSQSAQIDEVVALSAVADRLARPGAGLDLAVPPVPVRTSWAAVSPPRAGWRPVGTLPVAQLERVADDGIAEITRGAPDGSGAAAVERLRQRVWARPIDTDDGADGLPAGVAFAAKGLGFLVGESAAVLSSGRWFRVSTDAGHVLVR